MRPRLNDGRRSFSTEHVLRSPRPIFLPRRTARKYFHFNAVGHTVATSNAAGTVQSSSLYEAYGNIVLSTGSSDNNRLANTKERDFSIGLDNHGFRYYDPEVGRYVSLDPMGPAQFLNLYLYVENNPINFIDPMGLQPNPGEYVQMAAPDATEKIMREGFKAGRSGYTWFASDPKLVGGPAMRNSTVQINVSIAAQAEAAIPYKVHHAWYLEAEARLAATGLKGNELKAAANAERWQTVWKYMANKGASSYSIEVKGGNYMAMTEKAAAESVSVRGLSGKGAGQALELMKKSAQAAEEGAAEAAATRWGKAATVLKWGGRIVVAGVIAKDVIEIGTAEKKLKTTFEKAAGWAGAWAGAKALGAAGAEIGASFEGVGAVPGALILGTVGAVGGYVFGTNVASSYYEWVVEKGVYPGSRRDSSQETSSGRREGYNPYTSAGYVPPQPISEDDK